MLAVALCAIGAPTAQAQTDVVLLKNGDRLTGEIKLLGRGKVGFDTRATGVVNIEWDDVAQLVSRTNFEAVLDSAERLYGSLEPPARQTEIRLKTGSEAMDLPMRRVVQLTPIKAKLIDRIDMTVDVGDSLTKVNGLTQTTFGYDFDYRAERNDELGIRRRTTFGGGHRCRGGGLIGPGVHVTGLEVLTVRLARFGD